MKKMIITILFGLQSGAQAAPVLKLKDYSVTPLSSSQIEVVYKKEKIIFEKKSETQFLLNGQPFSISTEDTFEQLESKMQKAYRASQKKSASVQDLLIPKAEAITPLLAAILGGGFGFIMCHGSKKAAQGYEEPAAVSVQ